MDLSKDSTVFARRKYRNRKQNVKQEQRKTQGRISTTEYHIRHKYVENINSGEIFKV